MMQKLLFVFCFIGISAGAAAAQKTVTNADLEVYRQERLKAEKEYRESYERLGMPSPEELRSRSEKSLKETIEMSDRLRQKRLEEERLEVERMRAAEALYTPYLPSPQVYLPSPGFFVSTGVQFYNGRRHPRFRSYNNRNVRQGYFAGGQFWSSGPRTVSRPIVRIRRR